MSVENDEQISSPDPSIKSKPDTFVFFDTGGSRWPKFRLMILVAGVILIFALTVFARTLFVPSQLKLSMAVQQLKSRLKALQNQEQPWKKHATPPVWQKFIKFNSSRPEHFNDNTQFKSGFPPHNVRSPDFQAGKEIRLGFYANWDPDSLDSLKANADKLTHLSPDWMTLEDGRGRMKIVRDKEIQDFLKTRGIVLLPLLSNMASAGNWVPDVVEGLINSPFAVQEQFAENLKMKLKELGAGGVILDFEDADPSYREAMTGFLKKTAAALHAEDLELWLCIPMGPQLNIFDLDTLSGHIDRFVAMLHDENAEWDPPGPIASQEWFNGWLDTLVDEYGESLQWVIALGSYGYDWAEGETEAMPLSFQDVMSRALRSSLESCDFDGESLNPNFFYENAGINHTVWFLDAITFLNQLKRGRDHHIGGVAISRLGTEDPGIWKVLDQDLDKPFDKIDLDRIETIRADDVIAHIDRGNFLSIEDEHTDGKRRIIFDKSMEPGKGLATALYEKFPSYTTIVHKNSIVKDAVALTFDDGPDPDWTPQILDILKAGGVKAAFFMVGANMEKYPDLVRRIVNEGHAIGVHTYTHPNIALVSKERAYLEFNVTQRLVEAITGRSTILFRPPYNADTNPHEPEELVPIKLAQTMGYITVSEDIDPEDWSRPGVDTMVERIKTGRQTGGEIILLHDAGGDRSRTVAALPKIIEYLKLRGDNILSLPEMLGAPLEQIMPAVPEHQQPLTRAISSYGFMTIHTVTDFFWAFMIVATCLVVLRTLVVAFLAIQNRRQDAGGSTPSVACLSDGKGVTDAVSGGLSFRPPVSVLIAAYNEEKVIYETLMALLSTDYKGEIEILVVDDGSTDNTAGIVEKKTFEDNRIRLLRQINSGKAVALKRGLNAAQYEIVISLDADTQFEPGTIGELVAPFADHLVGAVSGRARVGNPKTMVARFQSLEYTSGFNLDRRAYHQLDCITVVPGAVSALRKSAVMAVGGISTDTLAEDTDLTLCLHKGGFKVNYASRAVAWTEAPETIRAFSRQRFRWAFGTLQCLWKHRGMLFDLRFKALGWFSLPSTWFFNIFLVAIGPIIDAVLLISLVLSPAHKSLYIYFGIFLLADLLMAAVACRIEKEPMSQIMLVVPMRFVYRPVLSYTVARAIIKAIKGVWVGWGKLDRTASVISNRGNKTPDH